MTLKCRGCATTVDDLIKLLLCCCRHSRLDGLRKEESVTAPLLRMQGSVENWVLVSCLALDVREHVCTGMYGCTLTYISGVTGGGEFSLLHVE